MSLKRSVEKLLGIEEGVAALLKSISTLSNTIDRGGYDKELH